MRISLLLLIVGLASFITSVTKAQNKYALLIGINDYYSQPGVRHPHSLEGCVNDAISMKNLLIDRFAFDAINIQSLYDAQATKKSILSALKGILEKSKAGDAMVFFFSGHGVWIENDATINDPVKRGMSQAIVTSDLFAEQFECLVKDATLKKFFNQFVDKKVKVTTLFDCCYAGNLMMMPAPFGENKYEIPVPRAIRKSLTFSDFYYVPKTIEPPGCDPKQISQDTIDSDLDGVPDCADFEVNTLRICFPVDSLGIGYCEPKALAFLPENISSNLEDSSVGGTSPGASPSQTARAFNLVDAISINDAEIVPRPSERPNSGFLTISGTSDKEKGLEITDESGVRHGAFTKALLEVYRDNPPTLSVGELFKKISALMLKQQYRQTATYHSDPARLSSNLIGADATRFKKSVTAKCIDVNAGMIVLDKGLNSGITKGNVLMQSNPASKLRIQVVSHADGTASATAIDLRMVDIKKGSEFVLADGYTMSAPLIKIYVGGSKLTASTFSALFEKKVKPFVKLPNYRDYNLWTNEFPTINIFFNESNPIDATSSQFILERIDTSYFHVFLPIPGYIADACIQTLRKDQNIEVVNTMDKADFVLCLNYAKPRAGKPGEFVFTFCKPNLTIANEFGARMFYRYNVKVGGLNIQGAELAKFTARINQSAREAIRGMTNRWMNDYPKR